MKILWPSLGFGELPVPDRLPREAFMPCYEWCPHYVGAQKRCSFKSKTCGTNNLVSIGEPCLYPDHIHSKLANINELGLIAAVIEE
jgi:hypothetical protein